MTTSKPIGPWHCLTQHTVYENPWLRVEHHQVKTPANTDGIYGKICFKNTAVGILPVDDEGNTYLVRQFRYPLAAYSWEIPEGGSPLSGATLATAQRELREETGLRARRWYRLLGMHLSNSVSDEYAEVFLALDLEQGVAQPEPSEDIVVRKLPLFEAMAMAMNGEISDAISVAALLKLKLLLADHGGDMLQLPAALAAASPGVDASGVDVPGVDAPDADSAL